MSTDPKPDPGVPIPPKVELEPPPAPEPIDNSHVEAALTFLKVGAPLQNGTPDNPNAVLAKLRKSAK